MGKKMGGTPQTRRKEFKLSNHLCQTHEIFRVGKYYKKNKINEIWGYQSWGFPLKWGRQKFELLNH